MSLPNWDDRPTYVGPGTGAWRNAIVVGLGSGTSSTSDVICPGQALCLTEKAEALAAVFTLMVRADHNAGHGLDPILVADRVASAGGALPNVGPGHRRFRRAPRLEQG